MEDKDLTKDYIEKIDMDSDMVVKPVPSSEDFERDRSSKEKIPVDSNDDCGIKCSQSEKIGHELLEIAFHIEELTSLFEEKIKKAEEIERLNRVEFKNMIQRTLDKNPIQRARRHIMNELKKYYPDDNHFYAREKTFETENGKKVLEEAIKIMNGENINSDKDCV